MGGSGRSRARSAAASACVSASSRARAATTASRTRAGAVPPGWLRLATEPSSVSAANTSSPISASERLQLRERQIGEVAAALIGPAHRARDGLVRVAERHALAHQVIGEIGGGRMALGRRRAHPRCVDRDAGGDEIRHDRERVGERVDDVEQRLLVLLVVAVVGERLRLHQHQQRDQVAGDASGLAAGELDDIGILLLRHDRRSGAEAIGERHERKARIHPPRELFGEARDVRHRQRGGGGELDGEIPIGHRVEGIVAERFEAELARDPRPIDRERRARERRAAERKAVDAPPAIAQTLGVAREHRLVGEQMMTERDRLRDLQMRVAGHDRFGVPFGERDESPPQRCERFGERVDLAAKPEPQVGRDLIVARASRVQALAGVADERGEPFLDVEMDVFEVARPREFAAPDLGADRLHPALDRVEIFAGENADRAKHSSVSERAGDVCFGEAAIEFDGRRVAFDPVGHRLAETPGPGGGSVTRSFGFGHVGAGGCPAAWSG